MTELSIDKQAVAQSFSRYASSYQKHAFVQKEIGKRLLAQASPLALQPKRILDLGSGPGTLLNALMKAYPKAQIVELDISWEMANASRLNFWQSLRHKTHAIQGDFEAIAFQDQSFDLIVSNCSFQWSGQLDRLFKEIHRLLQPGGHLLFSSLGPDTLQAFKALWSDIDSYPHTLPLVDMHHYGDWMLKSGLHEPVVSQQPLNIGYHSLDQLMDDLKHTGARNIHPHRRKGLTPPKILRQLKESFSQRLNAQGQFVCGYEVIYGHAHKIDTRITKPVPLHFKK